MTLDITTAACISADGDTSAATSSGSFCKSLRICPKYASSACEFVLPYLDIGPRQSAVIVVQGGISADHHAPQWWHEIVGIGKAIDPSIHRVIAMDWLDARTLGASAVSSEDQAAALAALLDALGIERIDTFVGASYGGMVGLSFAAHHGTRVNQLLVLAAAHRPNPLATAQRAVQRGIVRLGQQQGCVNQALSLARQLAMTTYRGHTELSKRFDGGAEWLDGRLRLPVEDWLEHSGKRFAARFDAQRYLDLSESIDLHDVDPAAIHTRTGLLGFTSDRLVPLSDLCQLQQRLGHGATLEVIETIYGHDGFLKQCDAITPLLRSALHTTQHTESSISRRAS